MPTLDPGPATLEPLPSVDRVLELDQLVVTGRAVRLILRYHHKHGWGTLVRTRPDRRGREITTAYRVDRSFDLSRLENNRQYYCQVVDAPPPGKARLFQYVVVRPIAPVP